MAFARQPLSETVCSGLTDEVLIVVAEDDQTFDAGRWREGRDAVVAYAGPRRHSEELENCDAGLDSFANAEFIRRLDKPHGRTVDGAGRFHRFLVRFWPLRIDAV